MQEYIVKNASGLIKFSKGEHVLVDNITPDSNGEVKVFKMDCDWDVLLNASWNKVSYQLLFSRLVPADIKDMSWDAGTIERRIMNKTFTDDALDKAAEYKDAVDTFVKTTMELRNKLDSISNNLMIKVNNLTISADAYDADAFGKAMDEMKLIVDYIKDKPLSEINKLHKTLIATVAQDTFDPASILD